MNASRVKCIKEFVEIRPERNRGCRRGAGGGGCTQTSKKRENVGDFLEGSFCNGKENIEPEKRWHLNVTLNAGLDLHKQRRVRESMSRTLESREA